jgi:alpha-D-xyloside xylohydrolase
MVRNGTVIPHVQPAQSTSDIDWRSVELRVFSNGAETARGLFASPDGLLQTIELNAANGRYKLKNDPSNGAINWRITNGRRGE